MGQKILFIASYPESLINFRLHLIKAFLANDYAVSVIAPSDTKVMQLLQSLQVQYLPIEMERNGSNPFKDIFLIKKLADCIREERPDIVFSYTIKPVIYGTIAAKLAGVKNIFSMLTGTGYIFSKESLKSRVIGFIAKNMFKFSLKFNKKLFFQNKDNLNSFLELGLIKASQPTAVINGSGVDIHFFPYSPLPPTMSFLMIARLLRDKGVYEYVEAARILKKQYPQVVFKLVGWIDTNPYSISEKTLTQWVEEGVINYLGKLADVREAIKDSSVYVLPSYGEGTPRTVLEAMAMGRAIITTDVPGCRETVINDQNGFLIEVRNVDAIVKAMEYFIKHPERLLPMGQSSREIATKKYDVNKVNRCLLREMNVRIEKNPPFLEVKPTDCMTET